MSDKRLTRLLTLIFCICFGIFILFLAVKFVLPWTAPFILAFITAACIEPIVRYLVKHLHIKRWLISGLLTIALFALICFSCKAVILNATSSVTDFLKTLPETLGGVTDSLSWLNEKIYNYISSAPDGVREYLESALENIMLHIKELPGELSGTALKYLTQLAAHMPKILVFTATYGVGTIFISSRYTEVKSFILRQIPEKYRSKTASIKTGILGTIVKWLKAQLMLMGITFLELTAGFVLLRIPHPLLIAALTAIIDAFPVLGVGTVLIPWAVFQLITGNTTLALGLVILYAAITMIRSLLEPKLVSGQLGLHPVATLLAIYIGFSSIGIAGMILFPVGLIILKQLNDEGVVKLWK